MADEDQLEEVQRWTAKRRAALVLSVLKGETTVAEAARRHGLTVAEIEQWRDRFVLGAENALRARAKDEESLREEELKRLQRKVGELTMDLDILRGGNEAPPFAAGNVAGVIAALPGVSVRRVCRVFIFPRSGLRARSLKARPVARLDELLAERIARLIVAHPTFGYRRLWALLRFREGVRVNRKAVYRVLRLKGWLVHQRSATPRPRVHGLKSRAERSDQRWAMDLTHVDCGADGWGHLTAVIDCHDREVPGYEFALRGRANEAERALEQACISRFGTLRPEGARPVVRSDNGLVFQSRRFRAACRDYRLRQEFITPYTPEQNGMIERFFRSLKEECVWQHNFHNFAEARAAIVSWIDWYNRERPHQALGYLSPRQFRAQQLQRVA